MASEECDGCGASVPIAGGIADLWNANRKSSGGMTLEFEDGSEHFLCYACIERLPDYPTEEDVAELAE
ncbi:DUF7561 family protein [Haladaptatus salinisoli]|uniref:DUF7561 family protein n=1 Tax=Haladaptatus salinisoli TaxID=2884876 RepID=UPI001D0BCB41|nr:hypothetical protein [Haladaptatus salinisoli]